VPAFWQTNFRLIHSFYFYYSSSPLLLRGAPDTAQILCQSFTLKRHWSSPPSLLDQGHYVVARVGFEPEILRTKRGFKPVFPFTSFNRNLSFKPS